MNYTTPTSETAPSTVDLDRAKELITVGHEAFLTAMRTNNTEALLALLTDDVVFLPPNMGLLEGKESIRTWYDGILQTFTTTDMVVTGRTLTVAGDWGIEQGLFSWSLKPVAGDTIVTDNGKFIAIWHLRPDGSWGVQRDIWSSNLPPAGHSN